MKYDLEGLISLLFVKNHIKTLYECQKYDDANFSWNEG